MTRIAINGLGRIGRAALKIILSSHPDLKVVAVNDVYPSYQLAYMLNFDSVYGKYDKKVFYNDFNLYTNGKQIQVFNTPDFSMLPWKDLGIDIVLECSGKNLHKKDLEAHILAGAGKVIHSGCASEEGIPVIVPGVNNPDYERELSIISCGSATTNCVAPVMEIMGRRIGITKAILNTFHAYTSSQSIQDNPDKDLRRGRAAGENLIPASTEASHILTKVLPQYAGKFTGIAVRGPVPAGSLADITFITERPTSPEEVNRIFQEEAGGQRYVGILGVNTEPIVSSDVLMDPRAAVVDLTLTKVTDGDLVKVMAWYDNEWGYSNQMIREIKSVMKSKMEMAI